MITHRIHQVAEDGFITKGDTNEDPDQWTVRKEAIIGKALYTIPYIGYLGYFVRTPLGFILLIIIPATIIIITEIRNIITQPKKKPEKSADENSKSNSPET